MLAFEIQAGDDFGVKRIGLEWKGIHNSIHNPNPSGGEKTVAAGTPTMDAMTVSATFSAERENVPPQSLRLRAFADDYFPGRERAYSPYLVLHVLTPAEHFKWLIDQLSVWMGATQEVHDKELQLNQVNRELRDLPPEALDDPAQRKRIQKQAAAERANAARLDSLIELGKELVGEATKNKEFDPDQLESWAEILKKLEDPNTPGGDVNVDRSEQPDGKPGYLPANPTPLVLDHESGFNLSEPAGQPPQVIGGYRPSKRSSGRIR